MSEGTEYLLSVVSGKAKAKGIPSLCSSNPFVIKAALEYARDNNEFVLIEATANQVNQYGGYTRMKPADFKSFVYALAEQAGLDTGKVILGGDHLGPVVFKDKNADEAMAQAEELIAEYVCAGFEKIHIDTSMRLADDPSDARLTDDVIARRGARLCRAAEQALQDAFGKQGELVYVVGSEVPVPGGTQACEEQMQVTSPEDFENTYRAFEKAFKAEGLTDAFGRVIAVVVQLGVEFGDDAVDEYEQQRTSALMARLKGHANIAFEGHSTDYQNFEALCAMAADGIRILKVGPELTFALREGLFALQYMADQLGGGTDFIGVLDRVMLENTGNWEKYYAGTPGQIALKRKFSYSDRWRYYANEEAVKQAIHNLFAFLDGQEVPLSLFSQFMPEQYQKIRKKKLNSKSEELIKDKVRDILAKYYGAVE